MRYRQYEMAKRRMKLEQTTPSNRVRYSAQFTIGEDVPKMVAPHHLGKGSIVFGDGPSRQFPAPPASPSPPAQEWTASALGNGGLQ